MALIARDLLAVAALFVVPGALLVRWLLPGLGRFERGLVALGAGFGAVSVLAFTFAQLTLHHLRPGHVVVAALLVAGFAAWRLAGRDSAEAAPRDPPWAALIAALVGVIFLVNYDRSHFQYGCIHTVVQIALDVDNEVTLGAPFADAGTPQERLAEGRRRVDTAEGLDRELPPPWMNPLLFLGNTGQRYGTTAMIAPAGAVHGFFGFRLSYALHAALLAGFLALLLGRVTSSPALGAAAAAICVVNPWTLRISLLDENLMAATWAAGALYVAVVRPRGAAIAGLFAGLAVGIRHIDLLLVLAVATLIVPASAHRGRALRALVAGLTVALLHEAVHHQVAYGSPISHEHFVDEVWFSTPYTLFGRTFEYAGLLQWPFAETWVRTPYNGLPTALLLPLSAARHLGLLFVAFVAAGMVALARRDRRLSRAILLWAGPLLLLFAVLEDWLDPNKMGIPIVLLPAVAIGFAAGIGAVVRRPITAVGALALALLLGVGVRSVADLDVPPDPAFAAKYPLVRAEHPAYAAYDRAAHTRANLLPDFALVEQHARFSLRARLAALGHELGDRSFRQGPLPALPPGPAGPPVDLELDLSAPLVDRTDFLTAGGGGELNLEREGNAVLLEGLEVPWADRAGDVLVVHDPGRRIRIFLRFGLEDFGDFDTVDGFTVDATARPRLVRRRARSERVGLRVPGGSVVEVVETVSLDQVLIYRWDGRLDGEELTLSPARKLFHN